MTQEQFRPTSDLEPQIYNISQKINRAFDVAFDSSSDHNTIIPNRPLDVDERYHHDISINAVDIDFSNAGNDESDETHVKLTRGLSERVAIEGVSHGSTDLTVEVRGRNYVYKFGEMGARVESTNYIDNPPRPTFQDVRREMGIDPYHPNIYFGLHKREPEVSRELNADDIHDLEQILSDIIPSAMRGEAKVTELHREKLTYLTQRK